MSAQARDSKRIDLRFDIAPGYYLYRERMGAKAVPATVQFSPLTLPAGKFLYDETFGQQMETYRQSVTMTVVLAQRLTAPFRLDVLNQGCADKGLCYMPQTRRFLVSPAAQSDGALQITTVNESPPATPPSARANARGGALAGALK